MAQYVCALCGNTYDEEAEGVLFADLADDWECPVCMGPKAMYKTEEASQAPAVVRDVPAPKKEANPLAWPEELVHHDGGLLDEIHTLAETGESVTEPMNTQMGVPGFDEIVVLGAQLSRPPLLEDEPVSLKTVIGKRAKKPMELQSPIYVSHMSFGALSKETKIALAKGSAMANTAICSGEGGILPEEKQEAYKYIFEYVPNLYSVTDENLKQADAIEIKIGQGTKPGMGGHLPGDKVGPEIAEIRHKPVGEDILSPSRFACINTPDDLKKLVEELRERSEGRPVGVKIAAGHIEKDLAFLLPAKPDFVTVDGRGGATGSSPKFLKDASSIPTVYALYRAKKFIKESGLDIDLVITGGLRTSRDFVKAIAMGADAVAVASGALIALGCQRYRVCHKGNCPMGIATQDPELRKRLAVDKGAQRVANYLNVSAEELRAFTRCMGYCDVHSLSVDDIETMSSEISSHTNIRHV
ncbi:MAG: glutamate synthase-related protein [Christensenella sp.]|uniref:glutamate synthase-related protein n=1 Tax=Christensenella sp. TaxID=1935934 RepID=UPI002B1F755A|nr:glutamate synthase-related protein [Christensenella sp.]MEA5002646.1 glutamate synthase-related protein [Christensenella sp.]